MPGRERVYHRELFGPWLIKQISKRNNGVYWVNEEQKLFRIPWKHLNRKTKDENDYGIFKAWAIESGRYNEAYEDPATWKTNFRCALHAVTCNNVKMFIEIEDNSGNQQDPHKIYKVNQFPAVSLTPAQVNTVPNHCLAAAYLSPTPSAIVLLNGPFNATAEQNLETAADDDPLRISPDKIRAHPFSAEQSLDDELKQLYLDSCNIGSEYNMQNACNEALLDKILDQQSSVHIYQECKNFNGYDIPATTGLSTTHQVLPQPSNTPYSNQGTHYPLPNAQSNELWRSTATEGSVQPITNGYGIHKPLPSMPLPPHPQSAQYQVNNSTQNGYPQDVPLIDKVFESQEDGVYNTACENWGNAQKVEQTPYHNGFVEPLPQPCHRPFVQSVPPGIPKLTSWDVTVFYKGRQVLQQTVNQRFLINTGSVDPALEPVNVVCFPSIERLVDQVQIKNTKTILDNVGGGLLLEVNDFKLNARRSGKSKVYWSLSRDLENITQENRWRNLLERDVPTEIFDFEKFWNDLQAFITGQKPSPDYTIYLSFGQDLFKSKDRKFVLVKLVPHFCTFFHEKAQSEGASSLNSEISLQISTGSTVDIPCPMELDFAYLMEIISQD
ncbi:interferon regulatory factor 7 [Bombina bombina]|uniref:interferon regulatory factor 7 n=1 Tax=Bombina bombina TaxID=8345 RepID=UPI00235AD087|nr:interferon regulatory factor 7 [Bombina bombina]